MVLLSKTPASKRATGGDSRSSGPSSAASVRERAGNSGPKASICTVTSRYASGGGPDLLILVAVLGNPQKINSIPVGKAAV